MAFQNKAILRRANNIKYKNTQDKNTKYGNDFKMSLEGDELTKQKR
jgi:hypothetical protein